MKKTAIIVALIMLFAIGSIILMKNLYGESSHSKYEAFDVNEYNHYIEKNSYNKSIGEIKSPVDLKNKADTVLREIYNKDLNDYYSYATYFDAKNDVWMICGVLPPRVDGGVPYLIVKADDGTVLAVWHGK